MASYVSKVDSYFGKIKLSFKNIDRHVTLVKKTTINVGKMHSSQGEDCCRKTFPFSSKGSFDGDETSLIITGNGKGWTFANSFHTGTISIGATLNDISCDPKIDC